MADVYISDSTYAAYVTEYGDDAKAQIRQVVEENTPGNTDE
jgi:hypothetical protein